jgi:hypothetical protein
LNSSAKNFQASSELFEAYIALIRVTIDARFSLRQGRTIVYEDVVKASSRRTEQAIRAASEACARSTERPLRGYGRQREISQEMLNREIGVANRVYQALEAPVFASIATHEDMTKLIRRRDALLFAASELASEELAEEAEQQYQSARQEAFAERDAALADARAVYQREIAAMHLRHQERLRQYQLKETVLVAPFTEARDSVIAALRQEHERVVALEKRSAEQDLAALENSFYQGEQERLQELAFLKDNDFSRPASKRCLDYCERSTQLLKERLKKA